MLFLVMFMAFLLRRPLEIVDAQSGTPELVVLALVVLRHPAVQFLKELLRSASCQFAQFRQVTVWKIIITYFSLKVGGLPLGVDIVVDGIEEIGGLDPEDGKLFGGSGPGDVSMGNKPDTAVFQALDQADPHKFIQHGTRRDVAAVMPDQIAETSLLAVEAKRERVTFCIKETGIAGPAADDPCGPFLLRHCFVVARVRKPFDPQHLLAGKPGKHGDARDRLFAPSGGEALLGHLYE